MRDESLKKEFFMRKMIVSFLFMAIINIPTFAENDNFFNNPALSVDEKSALIEENIKKSIFIKRYNIKKLDAITFDSQKFQLNLFTDFTEKVDVQKRVELEKHFIIIGKTDGAIFNNVKIVVNKQTNYMSGTAIVQGKSYRFWTLPNGRCVIAETTHPKEAGFSDYYLKG